MISVDSAGRSLVRCVTTKVLGEDAAKADELPIPGYMVFIPIVSPDTSASARDAQVVVWRRMGAQRRLQLAMQMSDDARRISADGIRHRHPDYDELQVRWALYRLVLGDELFSKALPDAPRLPA